MTLREAWFTVIFLVLFLLLAMTLAGVVSEVLAPTVQQEIGKAWSQGPR